MKDCSKAPRFHGATLAFRHSLAALAVACATTACALDPGAGRDRALLLHPNGDVLVAGSAVSATDSVPGDAMLAGQSVAFDGFAGGSFLGAAGDQEVGGHIEGSARAVGRSVRLAAFVGRNVTVAGGSVEVGEGAQVMGNAYLGGWSVRLGGDVSGDVYIAGGEVRLTGRVGGDVRVEASELSVEPDARIEGELRYRLDEGSVASISSDAAVEGGVTALEPREEGSGLGFFVFRLLAFVLCGGIVVALFPASLATTADQISARPGTALGMGFLSVLCVPFAVVLTAATLVGLPLALIVGTLFAVSLYLAPVVPALWIGRQLLSGRDPLERKAALSLFAAGGAVVAIAMLLPWLGLLARALATLLGLGAVVLAIQNGRLSAPTSAP